MLIARRAMRERDWALRHVLDLTAEASALRRQVQQLREQLIAATRVPDTPEVCAARLQAAGDESWELWESTSRHGGRTRANTPIQSQEAA